MTQKKTNNAAKRAKMLVSAATTQGKSAVMDDIVDDTPPPSGSTVAVAPDKCPVEETYACSISDLDEEDDQEAQDPGDDCRSVEGEDDAPLIDAAATVAKANAAQTAEQHPTASATKAEVIEPSAPVPEVTKTVPQEMIVKVEALYDALAKLAGASTKEAIVQAIIKHLLTCGSPWPNETLKVITLYVTPSVELYALVTGASVDSVRTLQRRVIHVLMRGNGSFDPNNYAQVAALPIIVGPKKEGDAKVYNNPVMNGKTLGLSYLVPKQAHPSIAMFLQCMEAAQLQLTIEKRAELTYPGNDVPTEEQLRQPWVPLKPGQRKSEQVYAPWHPSSTFFHSNGDPEPTHTFKATVRLDGDSGVTQIHIASIDRDTGKVVIRPGSIFEVDINSRAVLVYATTGLRGNENDTFRSVTSTATLVTIPPYVCKVLREQSMADAQVKAEVADVFA